VEHSGIGPDTDSLQSDGGQPRRAP